MYLQILLYPSPNDVIKTQMITQNRKDPPNLTPALSRNPFQGAKAGW
jgi:hypothetical protein